MTPDRNALTRAHWIWMFLIGAMAAAVLLFVRAKVAGGEEAEEPSFWMKKKMEYSQNILAGLAKADFEAIEKSASSMNSLAQIENWARANTPEYKRELASFRAANKGLIRMAQDEDVDGATLAFMQLTQSCVQCHKLLRDSN